MFLLFTYNLFREYIYIFFFKEIFMPSRNPKIESGKYVEMYLMAKHPTIELIKYVEVKLLEYLLKNRQNKLKR